jgi:hypothetical protein
MNELIRDANENANDNGDNDIIPTQAVPPASQSHTTAQRRISLALLFSFADLSSAKIDLIHTHPVVTCVTLPNMGPIPLNGHFAMGTSFTENIIWLAYE